MPVVALRFAHPPGTTALVFGGAGAAPAPIALGMSAVCPAPSFTGVCHHALPIASSALATVIAGSAEIDYDNAVNRAPYALAASVWQEAAPRVISCAIPHRSSPMIQRDIGLRQAAATTRRTLSRLVWRRMAGERRPAIDLTWRQGTPRGERLSTAYGLLLTQSRPAVLMPFADGWARSAVSRSPWAERPRCPRPILDMPWGEGGRVTLSLVLPASVGHAHPLSLDLSWQDGRHPLPGLRPIILPPEPPAHYVSSPHLRFDDALPAVRLPVSLVFGRAGAAAPIVARVVIPILRSYLVVNDVSLVRVSDNLALSALTLRLSIDAGSWCWGWEANLPGSALEAVRPVSGSPIELSATVNGVNFRLLAERLTRDRRFASSRITVSGRGIAAELSAPYAFTASRDSLMDRTAQQLMAEALTVNGVGIGWSIDWQITDWLVPAGVWSHTGTPIEAVTRIAEAAGAYVQADRVSRTLHVLPRYPVAPWSWASVTPDYDLPSAATTAESIEWMESAPYNAVYVSGEVSGILARVLRAGSAGDQVAPMVVDALITHADAARQRGISILSDTGMQQRLTLETPVLDGVGIYPVGSFVRFLDGADSRLGLVRSLQIDAALPRVRQRIEVECHG